MDTHHLENMLLSIKNNTPRREFLEFNKQFADELNKELVYVINQPSAINSLTSIVFENYPEYEKIFCIINEIEAYLSFKAPSDEFAGKILAEIFRRLRGEDVSTLLAGLTDSRYMWSIIHVLQYTLSEYELDPIFAGEFFIKVSDKIKNDLASGNFIKAIDNYSFHFPANARTIIAEYIKNEVLESNIVIAETIIGAIRASNIIRQNEINIDDFESYLKDHISVKTRAIYYRSWTTTYYWSCIDFDKIFEILESGVKNKNNLESLFYIILRVIIKESDFNKIISLLNWMSNYVGPDLAPESKYNVIYTVYWSLSKKNIDQDLYKPAKLLLNKLLPIKTEYLGIWKTIDNLFYELFENNKDQFYEFFEIIVKNSGSEVNELLTKDAFQNADHYFSGPTADLIFTNLLMSEEHNERQIAFSIFTKKNNISIIDHKFNPSEKILRKIILEFAISILLSEKTSKFLLMIEPYYRKSTNDLQNFFQQEMIFQAKNYRKACFDEWSKIEFPSELLQNVLNKTKKYYENLQNVNALAGRSFINYHFFQATKLERRVQSKNLRDKVQEQSVFLNFVHKTQILYGDKWYFPGKNDEPRKFQELSYSVEFPRIENIDPEGMVLKRMNNLIALNEK